MDRICGNAVEVKKNLYIFFEVGLAGRTSSCAFLV